ncbi:hypothetical protein V8D89_010117 [Ganoderma adspersum]
MSVLEALTTSVIALESCNIFLLGLLLVTPAFKHSIVKALIASCLLRSVLDILPPIVHKIFPRQLGTDITISPKAISFCVVDSMFLGYVTVVKAAFAVNFTLPFLWLALLQIRPKSSADDHPHLTKRMVVILCISPFVWALPVLLTPIARIAHGTPAHVQYNILSCYFNDPVFTIISLVFTLIPLGISVVITMAVAFIIWRFSDTMLEHTGWLFVKTKRITRFATLVFVSMVAATLYTVVLSQWIHLRLHHAQSNNSNHWTSNMEWFSLIPASVFWEAITPMLFLVFAAQEEVYETWFRWLSHIASLPKRLLDGKHGGCSRDGPQASQCGTSAAHESNRVPPTRSRAACDAGATIAALSPLPRPVPPGKIIARPLSSPFVRLSSYNERGHNRSRSVTTLDGLTPAPHRVAAKAGVMAETPQFARSRVRLFGGPSSLTFGSHNSTGSRGFANSSSESYEVVDAGQLSTIDLGELSRECTRPDTPGSSRTFGKAGTGKRPTT